MKRYLSFIKKSFIENTVYRLDYFLSILSGFIIILVLTSLWKAIYTHTQQIKEANLEEMVTYAVVATILSMTLRINLEFQIEDKIRTGNICFDLIKPVDFQLSSFANTMGSILFNFIMKGIPLYVISLIVFKIAIPSYLNILGFGLSVFLSSIIFFLLSFITGMICFWTKLIWSYVMLKQVLVIFLSGMIIPLWFFPVPLKVIAVCLPFKTLYFLPTSIYIGKINGIEILLFLFQQFIWIVILIFAGRILWNKALRRISIQGG